MRVIVMGDVEGASGVDDARQTNPVFPAEFEVGRECQVQDINAAIRGLRKAGATQFDVIDGHGSGGNIKPERLDPQAKLLGGAGALFDAMHTTGLGMYRALVMVGQHSMAGTRDGFLSHSNSGQTALRINGRDAGEVEELGWLFGHYGVPIILVSGDSAAVREAQTLLPGVHGATIKTSRARDQVDLMPLDQAHACIEAAAEKALRSLAQFRPYTVTTPVTVEAILARPEMAKMAAIFPRMRMVNDRTVAYTARDYVEALMAYFACVMLAQQVTLEETMARLREMEPAKPILAQMATERLQKWATEEPPFKPIEYPR